MAKVHECVDQLIPFFDAVISRDNAARLELKQSIVRLEKEADVLKKELRLHLPNNLFMPVDRRDLLEVLTMQDKIAGTVRDIASLIVGRDQWIPSSIHGRLKTLVRRCVDAVDQAETAINELDELVETGFGPRVVELVENMLDQLDTIEGDTDEQLVEIYGVVRGLESDPGVNPIDIMFLYRVLDWIGQVADQAEKVGSRLQLMLAK